MTQLQSEPLSYLPVGAHSILDIGCNVGDLLLAAHQRGYSRLCGIDLNPEAIEKAKKRLAQIPGAEIQHASAASLPFSDSSFDVITCCEVLEHVPSPLRPAVIQEMARVLRPGGKLILTVPHDGLFEFLDPANLRLRFPRLFYWMSRWIGGQGREAGYVGQAHGIVWHHHFTLGELESLLDPHFGIKSIRWRGALIGPLMNYLQFPFYRRKIFDHVLIKWIDRLHAWDISVSWGQFLAYNVLVSAFSKKESGPSAEFPGG